MSLDLVIIYPYKHVFSSEIIALIVENVDQVKKVENLILSLSNQSFDSLKLIVLQKTLKAVGLAIVDWVIRNRNNTEELTTNI